MTASEDMPPKPLRLAVLLPVGYTLAWQETVLKQLTSMAGIRASVLRVAAPPEVDTRWRKLAKAKPALRKLPAKMAALPNAHTRWDVVLDLVGIERQAWPVCGVHGVWQLLDAQGVHLAHAWPCHAAISSGQGGELFLVRNGQAVLNTIRFFADPRYPRSFERSYSYVPLLLHGPLQELAHTSVNPVPFEPHPAPGPWGRILHELRGQALAWRRRLAARWLSESWMIGVIDAPIQSLIEQPLESQIRWLGRREQALYRADPFGVPGRSGRLYCEVYDYRTGLGSLEALELDTQDRITRVEAVPVTPRGHASYPYLFEHADRLYAVPETADQRRVELYEIEADGGWRRVATLLEDVAAVDATLFRWNGHFWLAYTDASLGPFDNLCLSYADELTGPWQRHALHPVKFDHRSSRPAGTPFVHEGALYRPAQDCGGAYGQATVINRVSLCTPRLYREELVRVCLPDPRGRNPHGLHTLSAWGERTLVDGKRYVLNRHELGRKLGQRFGHRRASVRYAES